MPEGITAGLGNTIYVGSRAGGGVWAGDVRTGEGEQIVPHWGGVAIGIEYEARANRLWVAGGPTGTVRVYDASSGDLLRQYTFSPAGFLNDLVVTREAVYVTDSRNAWLDVIPLGPDGSLPAADAVTMLPLTGIVFETDRNNTNGIVATRGLADRRRLVHGRAVPRRQGDGRRDPDPDRAAPASRTATAWSCVAAPSTSSATPTTSSRSSSSARTSHRPRRIGTLTSAGLSVPTTAAFQAGRLWVVNARFGITTTEYWVSQLPANP